jgi:hypothetical protein
VEPPAPGYFADPVAPLEFAALVGPDLLDETAIAAEVAAIMTAPSHDWAREVAQQLRQVGAEAKRCAHTLWATRNGRDDPPKGRSGPGAPATRLPAVVLLTPAANQLVG